MTTETKLGLLLGMGVIILVGIFISDHLSKANSQEGTDLAGSISNGLKLDEDHLPPSYEQSRRTGGSGGGDDFIVDSQADQPLPLPDDYEEPASSPSQSRQAGQATPQNDRPRQQASASSSDAPVSRQPRVLDVDVPPQATIFSGRDEQVVDGDQPLPEPEPAAVDQRSGAAGFEPAGEERVQRFDPDAIEREREQARRQERESEQEQQRAPESARDDSDSSSSDDSGRVIHYVKENETLSRIANHYYGSPNYHTVIYEANRNAIDDPNRVRVGVRLVIPDKAGDATRRGEPQADDGAQAATREYTVQRNETMWTIAEQFYGSGAKWKELAELNKDRIPNPDRLAAGDEILVPDR